MVFGFIISNTYAEYFYASVIYKLEKVDCKLCNLVCLYTSQCQRNHNVNLELIFNENLTLIIVIFNA